MSRRISKRKRLRLDPANQRLHKLRAAVKRDPSLAPDGLIYLPVLVKTPRLPANQRNNRKNRKAFTRQVRAEIFGEAKSR